MAGEAMGRVRGSTLADSIVMSSAARAGGVVLTTDLDDLERLRAHFRASRYSRSESGTCRAHPETDSASCALASLAGDLIRIARQRRRPPHGEQVDRDLSDVDKDVGARRHETAVVVLEGLVMPPSSLSAPGPPFLARATGRLRISSDALCACAQSGTETGVLAGAVVMHAVTDGARPSLFRLPVGQRCPSPGAGCTPVGIHSGPRRHRACFALRRRV